MSLHQSIDILRQLRLSGMAEELELQRLSASTQSLSFEERVCLLVDAERQYRERRRLSSLLKRANLRMTAYVEDIDFRVTRGLDRQLVNTLLTCDWIEKHLNVFITGPTGLGKTWLGCALGHQAARKGLSVLYKRFPRLLREFEIGNGDGSIVQLRTQLARVDLLILDDWGLAALTPLTRHELMEFIDDRTGAASILITSQLPVAQWHDYIGDPTLADAILDRIVHNAHVLELEGPTLRKAAVKETKSQGGA